MILSCLFNAGHFCMYERPELAAQFRSFNQQKKRKLVLRFMLHDLCRTLSLLNLAHSTERSPNFSLYPGGIHLWFLAICSTFFSISGSAVMMSSTVHSSKGLADSIFLSVV